MVHYLEKIDEKSQHVRTMIPLQVLADIDGARNPMQLTRERLERAATENQFMNGKIAAIEVSLLCNTRLEAELTSFLRSPTKNS